MWFLVVRSDTMIYPSAVHVRAVACRVGGPEISEFCRIPRENGRQAKKLYSWQFLPPRRNPQATALHVLHVNWPRKSNYMCLHGDKWPRRPKVYQHCHTTDGENSWNEISKLETLYLRVGNNINETVSPHVLPLISYGYNDRNVWNSIFYTSRKYRNIYSIHERRNFDNSIQFHRQATSRTIYSWSITLTTKLVRTVQRRANKTVNGLSELQCHQRLQIYWSSNSWI